MPAAGELACATREQMRQLVVAVKALELPSMADVKVFQDHELLRHLQNEYEARD